MHSTPLDVYEKIGPRLAVISTKQEESRKRLEHSPLAEIKRGLFPHQSAAMALEECDAEVMTTDGSYEGQLRADGTPKSAANAHEGTIVVVVPPGGGIRYMKMNDRADQMATPPREV